MAASDGAIADADSPAPSRRGLKIALGGRGGGRSRAWPKRASWARQSEAPTRGDRRSCTIAHCVVSRGRVSLQTVSMTSLNPGSASGTSRSCRDSRPCPEVNRERDDAGGGWDGTGREAESLSTFPSGWRLLNASPGCS